MVLIRVNSLSVIEYYPLSKNVSKADLRKMRVEAIAKDYGVTTDQVLLGFGLYLAQLIAARAKQAIDSQKLTSGRTMKSEYKKLSKDYKKSKNPQHKNDFWINSENLYRHIIAWQRKGIVYVGVSDNVKYPGTTIKVADVLKWMEKGTSKMPARPLFFPIIRDVVSRQVQVLFNKYVELLSDRRYMNAYLGISKIPEKKSEVDQSKTGVETVNTKVNSVFNKKKAKSIFNK